MDIAALLSSVPTGLWIGGEERAGQSTFEVLNPATEDVIAHVADATPQDGIAALDAAAAKWEEITDRNDRQSQIELYQAALGI